MLNILKKIKTPVRMTISKNEIKHALDSYYEARDKLNQVIDADLIDAAIYDFLSTEKRLNHIIKLKKMEQIDSRSY